MRRALSLFVALAFSARAQQPHRGGVVAATSAPVWLGEQLPLPLPVRTPEDMAFKTQAEQLYLLFNLVAGGKVAFDRGDWAEAADRWEAVFRTQGAPEALKESLRSWVKVARERTGAAAPVLPMPLPVAPSRPEPVAVPPEPPAAGPVPQSRRLEVFAVSGVISGGGEAGPGGAVVLLRRADGHTPSPKPGRARANVQRDKRFLPHVLAVTLGTTVEFRNEDELFHNVFSLTKQNAFDLPLYKRGESKLQTFTAPGPVNLLCNIHSSMQGWIYVSDTPWFAQADVNGVFSIKGVPPGEYALEVWHEWSVKGAAAEVKVSASLQPLAIAVDGDRVRPAFVLDKSGKPRQPQLGY